MVRDSRDKVLTRPDPENHTTIYGYDALSRNTEVTQPLGQSVHTVYDARDRLDYTLNARGQKLDYDYEDWGPVKRRRDYPSVSAPTPDRTISYAYDLPGNLTGLSDDSLQAGPLNTLTYDALNRPDVTTVHYLPGGDRSLDDDTTASATGSN